MLEMTSAIAWYDEEDVSTSTFVPSFYALAAALTACDDLMITTYRFGRSHPYWLPQMSLVYVAILFYFRIFDVYVRSGSAPPNMVHLVRALKDMFDFRRLMIPGPLVPYFQALSLCSAGDSLLGDISPCVPDELPQANDYFALPNGQRYLPNILALLDYPTGILRSANAITQDYVHNVTLMYRQAVAANNIAAINTLVKSPGFYSPVYMPASVLEQFRLTANTRLRLPDQINLGNVTQDVRINWYQFLRFRPLPGEANSPKFKTWFGNVASMMSDYSEYFSGSVSLADIPVSAGPAPHIRLLYAASTDDETTPSAIPTNSDDNDSITLPELSSLSASARLHTPQIDDLYRQLATVAQINARVHDDPDSHYDGEFWNAARDRQKVLSFDILGNLATYVAYAHSEQSLFRREA